MPILSNILVSYFAKVRFRSVGPQTLLSANIKHPEYGYQ